MSGGHYQYKSFYLNDLADDIARDIAHIEQGDEYNAFENCDTEEQKQLLMQEMIALVKDLHKIEDRVHVLEWYMSGDYGIETYLEKLKEI